MRKILMGVWLVLPLMVGIAVSYADTLKLGVVDLQQIIEPQDSIIRQKLNEQFVDRQEQIRLAEQTINESTQRLQNEAGLTLGENEANELRDSIQAQQRNASAMIENFQADYSRSYNREMNQYLQKVKERIDAFSSGNGYDLILQKDAIPYSSNELDVTQSILQDPILQDLPKVG